MGLIWFEARQGRELTTTTMTAQQTNASMTARMLYYYHTQGKMSFELFCERMAELQQFYQMPQYLFRSQDGCDHICLPGINPVAIENQPLYITSLN